MRIGVGAFEQLSLLGLSAAQIARRTRTPVRAVRTGLEVTGSAVAAGAMRRHDLTLEQAAVIAEFDGDSEAVEALTAAVQREPERFEHVVQRLRDDRAERVARAQVAESVGVPIVEQPGYGSSSPVQRLTHLKPAAQPTGTELSVQAYSGCPGHVAYITWTEGPGPRSGGIRCTSERTGSNMGTSRGMRTSVVAPGSRNATLFRTRRHALLSHRAARPTGQRTASLVASPESGRGVDHDGSG